jgi:hypothetical protein
MRQRDKKADKFSISLLDYTPQDSHDYRFRAAAKLTDQTHQPISSPYSKRNTKENSWILHWFLAGAKQISRDGVFWDLWRLKGSLDDGTTRVEWR